MNKKKLIKSFVNVDEFIKEYGIIKCPTRWAKGSKSKTLNTTTRSKKCMTYNTTTPMGIRTMNFDSTYNIPTAYNGVKMMMNNY